jgi:hypothetical protein
MSAQRLLALATLLAAGVAAAPPATAQFFSKGVDLGEGFLCCNVRTDGKDWISDSNYLEEKSTVIAVGTPLKHDGFGRHRVHVLIDGKRFSIGNDYSRDIKLEDFACRWIVKEDPKAKLAGFAPAIRAAILDFKVASGMTREQVLMAVGYPMSSENPSLEANEWKFWLHSFSPYTVKFDAAGRVVEVETDPATLSRVFVR